MRRGRARTSPVMIAGLWALVGCYGGRQDGAGAIDAGDPADASADDGADAGSDDDGDGGVQSQCGEPSPGASPIRRLTAWEYDNTIFDLLGDDSHPSQGFAAEGGSGFDNNADVASVTWLQANKYMLAAEAISARAVADLGALLPCDPAGEETACVGEWIATFGPRAWRRPLTAEEEAAMLQLYADARVDDDVPTSVGLVLQAFVQSPHFLYRVELGIPGEEGAPAVALDDFELASRLSYFLWGSMPDEALFSAAAAGELSTHAQVEAQARRMLDDPRARRMVAHFHEQWLGYMKLDVIDKDPELFSSYTPEIAAKQRAEAQAFTEHVLFEDDATLESFFTAPYTFVDAELAAFYGLDAPAATGTELVKVEVHDRDAAGVLSLGGVLASFSKPNMTNPIARGIFVREHLLCTIPPPPPDDADIVPPQPDPDATVREQFEQHRSDPSCSACHMLFDPIGFGFEGFDAVGRFRELENGQPVDASGELYGTDVDGPFVGAAELGAKLAHSEDVAQCVARQWFRFAYGRTESAALDECNLDTIDAAFAESGGDLRELLVSLTQTDAFMLRTAYASEGGA